MGGGGADGLRVGRADSVDQRAGDGADQFGLLLPD